MKSNKLIFCLAVLVGLLAVSFLQMNQADYSIWALGLLTGITISNIDSLRKK